jgi:excinuclease ABC subunit A
MREVPCPTCEGRRLKPIVLGGHRSAAGHRRAVRHVGRRGGRVRRRLELTERDELIGARVLKEIRARLRFLLDVGLDYLTLDRPRGRCPAARPSASGSPPRSAPAWSGCLYVLDEPSIGLHQRDNERLIETLLRLRDLGNTLIVVEHDEATIEAADHVVDIGPGPASTAARSSTPARSSTSSGSPASR